MNIQVMVEDGYLGTHRYQVIELEDKKLATCKSEEAVSSLFEESVRDAGISINVWHNLPALEIVKQRWQEFKAKQAEEEEE